MFCFYVQIKVIYYLEGDNTIKQTVTLPDGKRAYFTREFTETEAKMVRIIYHEYNINIINKLLQFDLQVFVP